MKIGILGGGKVGGTLGLSWTLKGHEVVFGVRNPGSDEMTALIADSQGRARAGSAAEAAAFGEVVVNALPWKAAKETLSALNLAGKVLLDCTNPILPGLTGLEVGTTTSGGEQVAQWAKGARVAKVFNTTGFENMANPVYSGAPVTMFYCSDDAEAKKVAATLAADTGFAPVDAGPLSNSRLLEPYALLWIWLSAKGGLGRDFALTTSRR